MKMIRLSIVTENQTSIDKAKTLADLIANILNVPLDFDVCKYDKMVNSYKIDFSFPFDNSESSILESIEKTNRLCSPWMVTFDRTRNEIELIFNKTSSTTYETEKLNTIAWANWAVHD